MLCNLKDKAIATNILSYSMIVLQRERTSAEVILYALYLYFLGLSFRNLQGYSITIWGRRKKKPCRYGNGFRDSILDTLTVVKEYLLF